MKSSIHSSWVRRSGSFLAGVSLTLLSVLAITNPLFTEPAFADPAHNKIANAILDLQQSKQRWIEIDLTRQRLIAWEGDTSVYAVTISTGKEGYETPTGTYAIQTKHEVTRMQGDDYDVPDVPFTMYYDGGYAIHGAYWHNNFGTPVSHGCTNVALDHAEWLFKWAEVGTPVIVHN
jgi:lipoprotein-anchoring transpeptidase ErfK/SrfK